MKYVLAGLGSLLVLHALYVLQKYIFNYAILSAYGQGYMWGKIILFVIGVIMIWGASRIHKKQSGLKT